MKGEAYRVGLDSEGGGLNWRQPNEDENALPLDSEPGFSPLNALEVLLLRPLVPEDQL